MKVLDKIEDVFVSDSVKLLNGDYMSIEDYSKLFVVLQGLLKKFSLGESSLLWCHRMKRKGWRYEKKENKKRVRHSVPSVSVSLRLVFRDFFDFLFVGMVSLGIGKFSPVRASGGACFLAVSSFSV